MGALWVEGRGILLVQGGKIYAPGLKGSILFSEGPIRGGGGCGPSSNPRHEIVKFLFFEDE
jgi:hypothetical protein